MRQAMSAVLLLFFYLLSSGVPSHAAPLPAEVLRMEEGVRQRINAVRRAHGLSLLQENAALAHLAREHSRRMAKEKFFAHVDPAGRSFLDRLREAGIDYRAAAENIFSSSNAPDPVEYAVRGWMESPGHRANILRPEFNQTGVGIWREGDTFYFTQVFLLDR